MLSSWREQGRVTKVVCGGFGPAHALGLLAGHWAWLSSLQPTKGFSFHGWSGRLGAQRAVPGRIVHLNAHDCPHYIYTFFFLRESDQVCLSECFPFRGTWFELKALPAPESLLAEAGNPHEKSLATGQRAEFL